MDDEYSRRRLLRSAGAALGTGLATGLAGCTLSGGDGGASPTETGTLPPDGDLPGTVALETLADGMRAPLDIDFAPAADRRYVAEQQGIVHVHESGALRDEPFLDLRETVEAGGEKGLLGIALHPEFAENRRLFVRYSAPSREGAPSDYSHTFVLAEFAATGDGRRVKRDTERTVLEVPQPQGNHNAGDIAFGPDGLLYVAVGDGGAGGDRGTGHVEDWYDGNGGGNGQDVAENLLGSILRIDVDGRDGGTGYTVPSDNPLVGREGLDEQYAWGLRNPYRMAFDGDDLFVGDVGQNAYEEVDLVEKGGNYGWNVKEATHCYDAGDCPDTTPADVRGGEPLIDPIVEYPHSGGAVSGISVIGGQVYRGSAVPALAGAYLFGDLQANGRLFAARRPEGDGRWPTRPVEVSNGGKLGRLLSVGRDADGEVYVLGTGDGGGGLHRVVSAE